MLGFRVFILYKSFTNHSSIKCLENEFAEKCTYDTNTILNTFVSFFIRVSFQFLYFLRLNFISKQLYVPAFSIQARYILALYISAIFTLYIYVFFVESHINMCNKCCFE